MARVIYWFEISMTITKIDGITFEDNNETWNTIRCIKFGLFKYHAMLRIANLQLQKARHHADRLCLI